MSENLLHEQTGQSQRPTILKIFNENKKKVFFSVFTLIVILACLSLYIENNKYINI